jgi:hypothetical protein
MAVRARPEETTVIVAIAGMPSERTATTGGLPDPFVGLIVIHKE